MGFLNGKMSFSTTSVFVFVLILYCELSVKGAHGAADTDDPCSKHDNGTCEDCSKPSSNCYWCANNKKCGTYKPLHHKNQNNCHGSDVYTRQCLISSKLLIIIVPCVVGGVLIILGCLIYCCCCRRCCRGKKDKFGKQDKKLKKERGERKQINDHRKAERQAKNDEIRLKYGLKPAESGESRYQRLGDNQYP